jgi:hypothetical protein
MKVPLYHSEVVGAHPHWASIEMNLAQQEEEVQVGRKVFLYQEEVAEVVMVYLY